MQARHRNPACALISGGILITILFHNTLLRAQIQTIGNVTGTQVLSDEVDFTLSQGVARVQMLDAGLVRVRVNPSGSFSTRSTGSVSPTLLVPPGSSITDTAPATYIVAPLATVVILKSPFRVVVFRPDGSLVSADLPQGIEWSTTSGVILNYKFAPLDEHYFGLGERGGPIDRRGRVINMVNVDWAGYGELTDPLYISIPFFYGLRQGLAWGLFFDNAAEPWFDMDSKNSGVLTFGGSSGELDYYVMTGPEPWRVANSFTRLTGYKPIPPKWTMGYHQSRYGYNSETEFLQIAATLRQMNIPCDALYFDIDYMNQRQMFTWDPVNFPSPQVMNSWLDSLGFHRVNIIEPIVLTTDPLWSTLSNSSWLLTTSGAPLITSIWYGNVSWIDFTRSDVQTWYVNALQSFLANGISATWNDLNEPAESFMPQAIYNFNGNPQTDQQARDTYALREAALTRQAQLELRPNQRPWSISRSGFAGIQRYSANWSGDTNSTFDSLRVSIEMSASMGISGQDQFGHDIGGFLGSPSAELFLRWLEFAQFTPLFRNHAMNTSLPREPWTFGAPYTEMITGIIQNRYRMLPYLYTLEANASLGGTPVLTPLFFFYPSDTNTYAQNQEFMLGPSLLVAPVYTEGATTRSVYLPAGNNWLDVYTDQLYSGGQSIVAQAPLNRIPVFVREGSILPGGPVLQYVNQPVAQFVSVDLFPGPNSSFDLYEDDGTSLDYQGGVYLKTQITASRTANTSNATITRIGGSWLPPDRAWELTFHAVPSAPAEVTVNGTAIAQVASSADLNNAFLGWYYDSGSQHLLVQVHDSPLPLQISLIQ